MGDVYRIVTPTGVVEVEVVESMETALWTCEGYEGFSARSAVSFFADEEHRGWTEVCAPGQMTHAEVRQDERVKCQQEIRRDERERCVQILLGNYNAIVERREVIKGQCRLNEDARLKAAQETVLYLIAKVRAEAERDGA